MSSKLCSTTKLPQADGAWPWRWVYTVTLLSAPFQVGAFLNISIPTIPIAHRWLCWSTRRCGRGLWPPSRPSTPPSPITSSMSPGSAHSWWRTKQYCWNHFFRTTFPKIYFTCKRVLKQIQPRIFLQQEIISTLDWKDVGGEVLENKGLHNSAAIRRSLVLSDPFLAFIISVLFKFYHVGFNPSFYVLFEVLFQVFF